MILIPLQVVILYVLSEYLNRTLALAPRMVYYAIMLPGTVVHETSHAIAALLMGARIHRFSILPSGKRLGYVEYTAPRVPLVSGVAISLAPMAGCTGLLVLAGYYLGMPFTPSGSLDVVVETKNMFYGTVSLITGLNYLSWETYLFLYLALSLGAGAAPSRQDILVMLPGMLAILLIMLILSFLGIGAPLSAMELISAALSLAIMSMLAAVVLLTIITASLVR